MAISGHLTLAADIGGTHSRLALAQDHPQGVLYQASYRNADFREFTEILRQFLQQAAISAPITQVCLALPAPVLDVPRIELTNIPWVVDRAEIAQMLPQANLQIINDFQAAALGTLDLADNQLLTLHQQNQAETGCRAVIGAGTGLGTAMLYWAEDHYHAHATEAGHISFAPQDEDQAQLESFLRAKYGHVSYERILSGPGLADAYLAFGGRDALDAAQINAAASQQDETSLRVMRNYARVYGSYTGNMALIFKPTGGIFLVGGVTLKTAHWLQSELFMQAFLHKGRMAKLAAATCIRLVLAPEPGLGGALYFAFHQGKTK